MNTNRTSIHAMVSNFGFMSYNNFEKLSLYLNPNPYSNIKNGIPITMIAIIYGMKNDPPPLV